MNAHDILTMYGITKSVRLTAEKAGCSPQVIRRILITNGIYPGEKGREIARLLTLDYTPQEIADHLKISLKTVVNHMPYTRGSYAIGQKSENAKRIARCRSKEK